ncbi:MAG: adenylate/guanylate cyclase domain-containing protein [Alphaproteobacteria bacterium]|nr:adenylate/guanylate cyclase domain-containing protein [Alphaproteobacteria bacterium]
MLRSWLHILLPLAILGLAIAARLSEPVAVVNIRAMVFDTFQRIEPREYTPLPVRIVDLDDASLEKIGQWPWPRTVVAKMVTRLTELGAAVVVFDIVFSEPDRTSPKNIMPLWPDVPGKNVLAKFAERIPDHDDFLGETMAKSNVVTGFTLTNGEITRKPAVKGTFAKAGDDPAPFVPFFSGSVVNLPQIEKGAKGNGSFNMVADPDGIVRRVPMIVRLGDTLYPTLAPEAVRTVQGAKTYVVKSSGASGEQSLGEHTGINNIKIGQVEVPTDANGNVYVHYTEYVPERYFPAWKLFDEATDPEEFKKFIEGNVILIGTSAAGLKDQRATPLSPVTAGVEIHAQVMEQMFLPLFTETTDYLERPDWATGAEAIYLLVFGLLLIVMLPKFGALVSAIIGIVIIAAAVAFSWYAYTTLHWLIDPIFPSVTALVIYMVESLITYLKTEAEKEQVRGAFSHYLSPAMVEKLADDPSSLALGGETKDMTLLFCDIRGFTTISEQFDAEGLTSFINRFLTPMTDIIMSNSGTVDKYMGDAIMAFWNAPIDDPDHARNASIAGMEMMKTLHELNVEWEATAVEEGKKYIPVNIGVGVNSGPCCVGNMGSDQRFDYSVLGDDVNLASRLEGQSKTYGVDIVIGENTEKLIDGMAMLEMDLIQVKGKTVPVRIFTLHGDEEMHDSAAFQSQMSRHNYMLQTYRAQDWEKAKNFLAECRNLDKEERLGKLYDLYAERIAEFEANPPPADWDGVFVATSK